LNVRNGWYPAGPLPGRDVLTSDIPLKAKVPRKLPVCFCEEITGKRTKPKERSLAAFAIIPDKVELKNANELHVADGMKGVFRCIFFC
jgi:hypothetical protein